MPLAAPDTEQLPDLDAAVPCEANPPWHAEYGTGDGQWLVRILCPACGHTLLMVNCDGCWDAIQGRMGIRQVACCSNCNHVGSVADFVNLVTHL